MTLVLSGIRVNRKATVGPERVYFALDWVGSTLTAGVTVHGSTGTARIDPVTHRVTDVRVQAETISAREGLVSLSVDGRWLAYAAESIEGHTRTQNTIRQSKAKGKRH